MNQRYERIADLLDYLGYGEYDDYREGYLEVRSQGTSRQGESYYNVAFERDGKKLQSWVVTVDEDDEIHGGGS